MNGLAKGVEPRSDQNWNPICRKYRGQKDMLFVPQVQAIGKMKIAGKKLYRSNVLTTIIDKL